MVTIIILSVISAASTAFVFPCLISASRADKALEKHFPKIKDIRIEQNFFIKGCRVLVKH